jgi:hypothetical protein
LIEPRDYTDRDRRVFGLVLGALLLGVALVQARKGRPIWPLAAVLGALTVSAAAVRPTLLAPVLVGWMRVAAVLAAVNAFVLMGGLFFLVITPLGLFKRLLGEDPLEQTPEGESYWSPHASRGGVDDYKRLF